MNARLLTALSVLLAAGTPAQSIRFDFDNAPLGSSLPLDLTVGGVTAHCTATGEGYYIQGVSGAPVVPVGFTGRFIYPRGIASADLLIWFSTNLTAFSIQYAPQELACDSSATMRVTAYLGAALVGTDTTNATPGTWPVQTLAFSSGQAFNNVVVHYDKPPATGGDYGTIFIADNMSITPAPPPLVLSQPARLADGTIQFSFANLPATSFTVLAAADPATPLAAWTALGTATEISPGQYQFTDTQATNSLRRFYRVSSP